MRHMVAVDGGLVGLLFGVPVDGVSEALWSSPRERRRDGCEMRDVRSAVGAKHFSIGQYLWRFL